MSNICYLTPIGIVVDVIAATVAFGRWLVEETEVESKGNRAEPTITTASLHLRSRETLVRSAEKLGYRTVSKSSQLIFLQSTSGGRLAIQRTASGKLAVHTAADLSGLHSLVRQHTFDRTLEHLKSRGMSVRGSVLANGEVKIIAQERQARHRDGKAEVKTHIHNDGKMQVEIDHLRGNRCQKMVADLAAAVGGEVMTKKESYYQPASIQLKRSWQQ
jgi:hypothetical protein